MHAIINTFILATWTYLKAHHSPTIYKKECCARIVLYRKWERVNIQKSILVRWDFCERWLVWHSLLPKVLLCTTQNSLPLEKAEWRVDWDGSREKRRSREKTMGNVKRWKANAKFCHFTQLSAKYNGGLNGLLNENHDVNPNKYTLVDMRTLWIASNSKIVLHRPLARWQNDEANNFAKSILTTVARQITHQNEMKWSQQWIFAIVDSMDKYWIS